MRILVFQLPLFMQLKIMAALHPIIIFFLKIGEPDIHLKSWPKPETFYPLWLMINILVVHHQDLLPLLIGWNVSSNIYLPKVWRRKKYPWAFLIIPFIRMLTIVKKKEFLPMHNNSDIKM